LWWWVVGGRRKLAEGCTFLLSYLSQYLSNVLRLAVSFEGIGSLYLSSLRFPLRDRNTMADRRVDVQQLLVESESTV
jgi:hypothetical protein